MYEQLLFDFYYEPDVMVDYLGRQLLCYGLTHTFYVPAVL